MPRRKTVQPVLPAGSFILPDGTQVIVDDGNYREIGKGLYKRDAYERKRDEVLEFVVRDYFDADGRKKSLPEAKDYLRTAKMFTIEIQGWELDDGEAGGGDDSATRKRLYKDIKAHIAGLEVAIAESRSATPASKVTTGEGTS